MKTKLETLFDVPLRNLGATEPVYTDIYIPEPEIGAHRVGVTSQFLENASDYHAAYSNVDYFEFLIRNTFAKIGVDPRNSVVLDIGSGSGNSVIPILRNYPDTSIVATDISPQLLAILRDHLKTQQDYLERCSLVCMDAAKNYYKEESYDLAIGAAILHHIIDPSKVIHACFSALKSGGKAVFYEPFENGIAILRLAYRQILDEAVRRKLNDPGIRFIQKMVDDIEVRMRDKDDPIFEELDDKWLFTRSYYETHARQAGWSDVYIYPINAIDRPFTTQAVLHLKLGMQAKPETLPQWAWDILSYHDESFSSALLEDLPLEACVVLTKEGDASNLQSKPIRQAFSGDVTIAQIIPETGLWVAESEYAHVAALEVKGEHFFGIFYHFDDTGKPVWYLSAGPYVESVYEGDMVVFADGQTLLGDYRKNRKIGSIGRIRIEFENAQTALLVSPLGKFTICHPERVVENEPDFIGELGHWWNPEESGRGFTLELQGDQLVVIGFMYTEDGASTWYSSRNCLDEANSYAGDLFQYQHGQSMDSQNEGTYIGKIRIVFEDPEHATLVLPNDKRLTLSRLKF